MCSLLVHQGKLYLTSDDDRILFARATLCPVHFNHLRLVVQEFLVAGLTEVELSKFRSYADHTNMVEHVYVLHHISYKRRIFGSTAQTIVPHVSRVGTLAVLAWRDECLHRVTHCQFSNVSAYGRG